MLKAIENGKISCHREAREIGQSGFYPSEDSLTSSVVGLLLYLPEDCFWQLLRKACYGTEMPEHCGPVVEFEFWPKWSARNTTNSTYIEPDVFIRFKKFDLIIEAKRWDDRQQMESQWKGQIQGYHNKYRDEDSKELYLLALGGIYDEQSIQVNGTWVVKARWSMLLDQIILLLASQPSDHYASIKRILEDLVFAFQLHGYLKHDWLEDWSPSGLEPGKLPAEHSLSEAYSWIK